MARVVSLGLQLTGLYFVSIGLPNAGMALFAAAAAVSYADAKDTARKQKNQARDAYNASLKDRLEMVDISADQARTIVYGRCRTVEGVRRRWVSGANDQKLTMIVSLAGHEIDAVEQVYFDEIPLTLDSNGYVQTAPYLKENPGETINGAGRLDEFGNATIALPEPPNEGLIYATWKGDARGASGSLTIVSLTGSTVVVSGGDPFAYAYISYGKTTFTSKARVRVFLGTDAQNVGAALIAEYPGKINSTDRFSGVAVLVVDLDFDSDVYPQGRPNVTAVIRGKKVYNPTLDASLGYVGGPQRINLPATWTYSDSPALCAYDYARHNNGWRVPANEIMSARDVADEHVWCIQSTNFTLRKPDNSTSVITLPRHTCNLVVGTSADPRESMNSIIESMAGRDGWAGGTWKFKAGRMPASVADMNESWLANKLDEDGIPETGPTLAFTNGILRNQKVNRVTGRCIDASQRYQLLPFPAVQDPVLIANDKEVFPVEVEYQAVSHVAHAQHVSMIRIKRNQASLRLQAECNMRAYPLELFDVVLLTLAPYAITNKTMEVLTWTWHPTSGVALGLSEITPEIYKVEAELRGRDPAPNTQLPPPWAVETLTGLTVVSNTSSTADGSIIAKAELSWSPAVSESVRSTGAVEIQYREVALPNFESWMEYGSSIRATIPSLKGGQYYVFKARFISAPPIAVRGKWSELVALRISNVPLMRDVGIALQAATVALTAQGDAAMAWPGGSPFPGITLPMASLSWVNNTLDDVTVQTEYTGKITTANIASSKLVFTWAITSLPTIVQESTSQAGLLPALDVAKVKQLTVPTGATITYTVQFVIAAGGSSAFVTNTTDSDHRLTAIKR